MHNVAHHLQQEAVKLRAPYPENADTFARSAFNRYYYAAFLNVRKTLIEFDVEYANSLSHKSIPDLLKGKVHKRIKSIRTKASKIGDHELVSLCQQASSQNLQFAETLKKAYAIRVVADYNPDVPVDFRSKRFTLNGVEVTVAHDWLHQAEVWSAMLLNVIRQDDA